MTENGGALGPGLADYTALLCCLLWSWQLKTLPKPPASLHPQMGGGAHAGVYQQHEKNAFIPQNNLLYLRDIYMVATLLYWKAKPGAQHVLCNCSTTDF